MEYIRLGRSGLEVARLGLGTVPFGTRLDTAASRRMVDIYLDAGGNLIDTANVYGRGMVRPGQVDAGLAEQAVAQAIKGRRERVVVATKGYWVMDAAVGPNAVGLSRAYLTRQVEASLRRLRTDYIDLFQCHAWDFYTPVEETLRTLDDFVRAGKIRYVGVSNWDGWHVVKGQTAALAAGYTSIVADQVWYNLADRAAEISIIPACRDQGVAIIAWGALGQGMLSGRYRRGAPGPQPGSRFEMVLDGEPSSWRNLANERTWATLDVLDVIAQEHDTTIPVVALRYLLEAGTCDVALMGSPDPGHLEQQLSAASLRLSGDEVARLRSASAPDLPYPVSFLEPYCRRESPFYGGSRDEVATARA